MTPMPLPAATLNSRAKAKPGRELTGFKVLLILLAFFGSIASVNMVMTYAALSTFSGLETAKPYEEGLAFNGEIAVALGQAQRHWTVEARLGQLTEGQVPLELSLRDAKDAAIEALTITVRLESPVAKARDSSVVLMAAAPGTYKGVLHAEPGQWDLVIDALDEGRRLYHSTSRIMLKPLS
jgi:nitrogen fixation protein FixH